MMGCSRFLLFVCFLFWDFMILGTRQLQSSQTQVLLQLRKQLEYPNVLENWVSAGIDLCSLSSPQVNITCQDDSLVTGITIYGDKQARPGDFFTGFPFPPQTLSRNFSIDSLVATLSRLNNLRTLSLVSLGIWGSVPDKIHRLQSLQSLDLSWNFLSGSVPRTVSRIVNLQVLKLDGNFFNGTVPDWLDSFSNLTSLSLGTNMFTGSFPSSLQRIASLTDINLSTNFISGKMLDLSSLSSLRWLDLSNNRFDSGLQNLPKGVVTVLLSNSSFSGRIPEQFAKLDQLQQLDLSHNALQGPIPGGLFALSSIRSLNFASNTLTGSLPMRLSCGSRLASVDISNNRLVGPLPPCLNPRSRTTVVNVDGNCLPAGLLHQHPNTYCAAVPAEGRRDEKPHGRGVGVLIGVILGVSVVMVVLAIAFVVLCRQYCPRGSSEKHLLHKGVQDNSVTGGYTAELLTNARFISDAAKFSVQASPPHRLFSLDEINAATSNFNKTTLMGEGSTGKIYKGRLESGTQIAIRCLTLSKRYTIRSLKLRLDLLAKLRHPNLVCLLGHCIDSEQKDESGPNKVYLIYEYVPNGNYRIHLSEGNPEKVLRWPDRLAILIGVAKAVHFLHTGVIPGFFSNRLKTNNILLNEHRIGKLSDYGLSVVAQEIDKGKELDGRGTWQMKSLEDDVHSFGLILLESLIGPSVCTRKESFLHNQMVSLGSPEGRRRIVDPAVLASCSQESLSIVASLTINCLSPESSTRPSFEDILWNLQYAAQVQMTSDGGDRTGGKTLFSP